MRMIEAAVHRPRPQTPLIALFTKPWTFPTSFSSSRAFSKCFPCHPYPVANPTRTLIPSLPNTIPFKPVLVFSVVLLLILPSPIFPRRLPGLTTRNLGSLNFNSSHLLSSCIFTSPPPQCAFLHSPVFKLPVRLTLLDAYTGAVSARLPHDHLAAYRLFSFFLVFGFTFATSQ